MPDPDREAQRLAVQRLEDQRAADETGRERMATLRSEQAASERERGKREGLAEAHTKDQDRQLLSLQEMHKSLLDELKAMNARLAKLETAFDSWTDTAKALAEKAISNRAYWLGVAAIVVAVIVGLWGKHI